MPDKKFCLGLTGRMASGKGEIVKVLQKFGFKYISLSDIVRERAAMEGKEPSRSQMQDIGNLLRTEGGAGILGKKVREKIVGSNIEKWIIDGIRNPAEIAELKMINSFYLIAVVSARDLIIKRLQKRLRKSDIADINEINRRLDREWGINEPPGGQQVGGCVDIADFIIKNNSTLEELENETVKLLRSLEGKNGL